MLLKNIITDIKKKDELKHLDDNFVNRRIENYLRKYNLDINEDDFRRRNKNYIRFFKAIRRELRIVYGVFRNVKEIRNTDVYKRIFDLTGDFNVLTDLGC